LVHIIHREELGTYQDVILHNITVGCRGSGGLVGGTSVSSGVVVSRVKVVNHLRVELRSSLLDGTRAAAPALCAATAGSLSRLRRGVLICGGGLGLSLGLGGTLGERLGLGDDAGGLSSTDNDFNLRFAQVRICYL